MGSWKLNLSNAPLNYDRALEQFYRTAFGPSPALYRQISLCGWRPLADHPKRGSISARPGQHDPAVLTEKTLGIEVYETADGMTIEVALSTIREDSLHLAVDGEKVIIRGERVAAATRKTDFPAAQRCKPRFQYFIPLPATISTGGFRAQLEGDIVRIYFDKRSL
ncbi:MAG: Hsp20/alpha crystallin family protein [Desulfobacteraceae bacterium]|nr:MAG: Hsp20/alpha crystallin family protein [Desulfobacteraceae bacterium]